MKIHAWEFALPLGFDEELSTRILNKGCGTTFHSSLRSKAIHPPKGHFVICANRKDVRKV
ncbi:hypothetical protein DNHGIG_17490 [Collibacillus ludicampi]|uniref:Uncharacterized protein n=1 Tax=Collibacillus ludicampi TaxID=2771369 RepID=A0AAV4LEK0_9BACL|nr:hypothetical protein [Collibacillus ludicampi]GIM46200.1 hypothetical protein DNHGIG_17490 [Collibacillus ludicampi]